MTSREDFLRITKMLRANYSFMEFDRDTADVWYVSLQHFDIQDLEKGVRNYMAFSAKQPTIADITEAARAVRDHREPEFDWSKSRTVRCPKCQDDGGVTVYCPKGEYFLICSCEAGQRKYGTHRQFDFDDEAAAYYFGPGWTVKDVTDPTKVSAKRMFSKSGRPFIQLEVIENAKTKTAAGVS